MASADVGAASVSRILQPSERDLAPVNNSTPPRLRRTDEEQPGAEMSHLAFFGDGKTGLYFEMRSGEINGQLPNHRIQCAMVPFHLAQGTDGSVSAVADMTTARFVTNNINTNEYRNCNHPSAYTINNGNNIVLEYNVQFDNSNDTKRYAMVFDRAGNTVMPQTQIYAKNNDDCSMNQDSGPATVTQTSADGTTQVVAWRGCNGNGSDDGWLQSLAFKCDAGGTSCTFQKQFDVSLCQREERSHGFCSVGTDPNTAICSWTEGNNQPQRDGTWLAAVDITPGKFKGNDQDQSVLWKQQIDGRRGGNGTVRTYAMRAMHERIMAPDTTGKLVPTDLIIWRNGQLHGNNNTNNGKGGTYYGNEMAIIEATKTGMNYKMPLTEMQSNLVGLDGTHLGMTFALFGTTDHLQPGVLFLGGSHTGGGYSAKVRAVTYDSTANTFKDLGSYSIAPYDRHLYSNYLGNNPGNQGRNFSGAILVANPFVGQNGSRDAYLAVFTTTGKDPADINRAELKLSSYITVLPVSQLPAQADPGGTGSGSGSGSGSNPGGGSGSNPDPNPQPQDPGSSFGGCSAGGSSGGATLLLIGLAAFIRRRR